MLAFKYLLSICAGAFLSFAGVLFHNSLAPLGLIAALVISYGGVRAVGQLAHSRLAMWFSLLGWFAVLIRASTAGVSFERLVVVNTNGNLYTVASVLLVIIAASVSIK